MTTDALYGGADPSNVSQGGTYYPERYSTGQEPDELPRGLDAPEVSPAASSLRAALTAYAALPRGATSAQRQAARSAVSLATLHFQQAWGHGLATDGAFGTSTRRALADALVVSLSSLPARVPSPSPFPPEVAAARAARAPRRQTTPRRAPATDPSTPPADTEAAPQRVAVAAALAKWTEHARAVDSTANTVLAPLHANAARIAHDIDEGTMSGLEVGEVPRAPTSSEQEGWAAALWRTARELGDAGRRDVSTLSDDLIRQGEAALADVRRRLDRETDTAIREALNILEGTLTAILRPVARAVRATGLGGPALLIGLGLLMFAVKK